MKYGAPKRRKIREFIEGEDVWTIITPSNDTDLSDSEVHMLEDNVHRVKDGEGDRGRVFYNIDTDKRNGERVVEIGELNVEMLAKALYEHRRYSLARGFSDAEMDVLRAVEFHDATRVGVDEITGSEQAEGLAESTVYKALRTLQEKELIEKVRPGVYQYDGP